MRDAKGRTKLTPVDLRGLSALFWTHLNLYGRLELDMSGHLDLDGRGQGEDGRGADLRQGHGDAAAAVESREHLDGQDGTAGGGGVAGGGC
ncbi:hypothetical protein [Streptosporangium roseum]|uniref:hypothetical protein n=1 Tax=Streptosporangium roseum TaxID=2001 RepID=UPI0012DE7885|nr:hypothetical protein [Streptosporangium roseum]